MFGSDRSLTEQSITGPDLVVKGNRIRFGHKKSQSATHFKGTCWTQATMSGEFCHTGNAEGLEVTQDKYPESRQPRSVTVDRAVQIDCFALQANCNDIYGEISDPNNMIKTCCISHANIAEKLCGITCNEFHEHQSSAAVCEANDKETSTKEPMRLKESQQKEILLAKKLRVLAEEAIETAVEPMEIRSSSYLVAKKKTVPHVLVINFPDDVQKLNESTPVSGLEDDDELSIEILPIDTKQKKKKKHGPRSAGGTRKLYPVPCPAFPMELSFPPVNFDYSDYSE